MDTLESLRRSLTEGVADWLVRLVDSMPGTAPPRTDSTSEAPVVAGWLHRFVRDIVTADPVTREPLSNIQIFLIESALDCVDWEALARHPQLRHLDWEHAGRSSPKRRRPGASVGSGSEIPGAMHGNDAMGGG